MKNKKVFLSVLLSVMLVCFTALFACGKRDESGHTPSEWQITVQAKCETAGSRKKLCTVCGKEIETETIPSLGHTLGEWKTEKSPTETEKGLKVRKCMRKGCEYYEEEDIPELAHTHSFVEKADKKYLKSAATCVNKAVYYTSCSGCGERGTETFEYGEPLNHSFTHYTSNNNATCTQDGTKTAKCDRCGATDTVPDLNSKLGHKFTHYTSDGNATYDKDGTKTAKCDRCDATETIPDEGSKLESKMSFKTLTVGQKNIDGNIPVYGKVSNAQKTYSFIDEVLVAGNIQYIVSLDIYGIQQVATKTIPLKEGDNVVYITEQLNGNPKAVYEVTVRRREIYTVTFNSQGGTAVENQAIEEDSLAIQPATPTKKGYAFNKWTFDFSTPIIKNIEITAEWDIIHYYVYYNLNGGIVENENPATYTVEDTIVLNVPEKTGYDFKQWDNDGKIEKGTIGDVTFTAFYTIIVYKINYDCGSGDNNSDNLTEYTIESETITLKDAYYINADFIEWQKDGQKITEISKGSFGDLYITAVWDMYDVQLKESDGTYTAVGKNTDKTYIVIKSSYKGKPVTSIGSSAFSGCSKLTSVTIPESITSIGSSAFRECSKLTDVIWNAENCESAGSYTSPIFKKCDKLTNVIIGNNVKHIPSYAFFGCFNFVNIYITDLTAWCNISGLENLMGDGTNETYGSSNKQLYLKNKRVTNLIIPDGVTSIGDCAFRFCTSLTSITIPDGVTFIGDYAFFGCKGLTSITIPDSVTSIGELGFFCCEGLTNAIIGNRVTSIGDWAFYGCKGLTSAIIGDRVTSIGDSAFYGCEGLTSITIPDSVTSIGGSAFENCSGLTSVAIGNGVTSIGDWAFYRCGSLKTINYEGSKIQWESIDKGNYWNRGTGTYTIYCTDGEL